MDYLKNVVKPIRQVAPRRTLRGLVEDYGHIDADVVLLVGEVHYERKPVRYNTSAISPLALIYKTGEPSLYDYPKTGRVLSVRPA
jgi:hypothetical protein